MKSRSAFSLRTLAAAALLLLTFQTGAHAQSFPSKPVRLVVPAGAGGSLDMGARIIGEELSKMWGQPVIVENKPGAGFSIGTASVAQSAPDGHTLLLVSDGAYTINPLVYPQLAYKPERDLAPVVRVVSIPLLLLVNKAVPAQTLQEFLAYLKARPGALNHANNSAITILASEMFKSIAMVDYVDVPYKSAAQAVQAVMSGEAQFCIIDAGTAAPLLEGGSGRALAVLSTERFKLRPDIPTVVEGGLPGAEAGGGHFIFVPAGTPQPIVDKLNADIRTVLATSHVADRFQAANLDLAPGSPTDALQILRTAAERWARLVKERNISLQ